MSVKQHETDVQYLEDVILALRRELKDALSLLKKWRSFPTPVGYTPANFIEKVDSFLYKT